MYKWFERFYYVIIAQYNFLLAHNIFVHTLSVITIPPRLNERSCTFLLRENPPKILKIEKFKEYLLKKYGRSKIFAKQEADMITAAERQSASTCIS
jgi:hypothetical protein